MRRTPLALAITALTLAITAASAPAATTRAEYVAQVDPICQAAFMQIEKPLRSITRATNRLLQLLGDERRSRAELKRAIKRVSRKSSRAGAKIGRILSGMVAAIATVPPAPGDELIVAQWVDGLIRSGHLNDRARQAARRGKVGQALRLLERALRVEGQAQDLVRDFGFQYCA
jgi:hypothetical protein